MNILLDGKPLGGASLSATVGQALDTARKSLAGTDLLVLGIRCDEREISPELLETVLERPAGDFARLEFVTGHPVDVVLEALRQTRMALADSFTGIREAAEALSRGRVSEAMSALVRCLAIWGQTHEAVVQGGALCRLDFEGLVIEGRPLLDWLHDLARQLRGLKSAIESRDHVLLGDILQYELDETLRGWECMLDGIIRHLEQTRRDAGAPGATVAP